MNRLKRSCKTILLATTISLMSVSVSADTVPKYDRKEWKHWKDADRDCEDTREEALKRDATYIFWTNKSCTPTLGVWRGPYTDELFLRSGQMDADHIIPLKYAHYAGGWQWPKSLKQEFANDLENIIMTSASANRSKGAKGPSKWMPPLESYHCEYLKAWGTLINKYHLSVTKAESVYISTNIESACDN